MSGTESTESTSTYQLLYGSLTLDGVTYIANTPRNMVTLSPDMASRLSARLRLVGGEGEGEVVSTGTGRGRKVDSDAQDQSPADLSDVNTYALDDWHNALNSMNWNLSVQLINDESITSDSLILAMKAERSGARRRTVLSAIGRRLAEMGVDPDAVVDEEEGRVE
jgi:hypothetical protein